LVFLLAKVNAMAGFLAEWFEKQIVQTL